MADLIATRAVPRGAFAAALAASMVLSAPARPQPSGAGTTKISITYDEVLTPEDGGPQERKPLARQYILKDAKTLMVLAEDMGGAGFKQQELGRSVFGNGYRVSYNVVRGNIVITTEYNTHRIVRTVGTNGRDKCWMKLSFIRTGAAPITIKNRPYSEAHAENVVCSIESAQ